MRPPLTTEITLHDFHNFYWLKRELYQFCKENELNTSGSKAELSNRIVLFLQTGEKEKTIKKPRKKKQPKEALSLNTIITEDHRCSQEVRLFFQKAIHPKFHFSTFIQNYFKENVGKTYQDVVKAWHEEEKRKKDPFYKKQIGPQFEYNRFISDYFADPKNKNKSRKEAIESWNKIKMLPGSNKYIPNKN